MLNKINKRKKKKTKNKKKQFAISVLGQLYTLPCNKDDK